MMMMRIVLGLGTMTLRSGISCCNFVSCKGTILITSFSIHFFFYFFISLFDDDDHYDDDDDDDTQTFKFKARLVISFQTR